MNMKKTFAILGSLLILGAGVGAAAQQNTSQEKNQRQGRSKVRNGTQGEAKTPLQHRFTFRDENGDGICDSFRDHDSDGIPNGQDPDWSKAENGKGQKSQFGNKNFGNKHGFQNGQGGNNWRNQSFRQSRTGGGLGECGKDGSRGNMRKGGKQ